MRLTDLNPRWVGAGGEGVRSKDGKPVPERNGVGVSFDCPCGGDCIRAFIPFENPLDGGPSPHREGWHRDGETFEGLTLRPSIQRSDPGGCKWHGFIRNGDIVPA